MELKLGNFYVKDVVFGGKTAYENGVLTINKEEALNLVREDPRITKCDLVIAKPGDKVRLIPIQTSAEARCKVTPGCVYPGQNKPVEMVGEGTTHCLKDMSVMTIGKYASFASGILDMSGEGAKYSRYSQYINVCLVMESSDEEAEAKEVHKMCYAHDAACIKLAEYLGETVRNLEPDEYEVYVSEPLTERKYPDLPKVAYIWHWNANGLNNDLNQSIYGWSANRTLPMYISANEILDTAMYRARFSVATGNGIVMDYCNNPTVKRLCKEHGKTIDFVGIILSPYFAELSEKDRVVKMTVQLCKHLAVDATVNMMCSYGNVFVDYLNTIAALEDAGIVTAGISLEASGKDGRSLPLILTNEKADALVTCGSVAQMYELPPMETVYGDIETLNRDLWSGAWIKDDTYGPSLRPDGSILLEDNCIWSGSCAFGFTTKTMKEF